jgi:hypothetical protein
MNGKKAKQLRRQVHQDRPQIIGEDKQVGIGFWKSAKQFVVCGYATACTGLRREYQMAKRGAV